METFLVAARTLHFAATISLTGVFAWECVVVAPVLAHAAATGAISVQLGQRLGWLTWASLALALVSGAAWLAAVAAEMTGKPLGDALSQGALAIVLTRTRFGTDWLVRLGLAVLVTCCLLARRRRRTGAGGAVSRTALMLASLMLATLAWAGHGGATPGKPGDLHLAADIFHLLAAGTWLGTLVPFALLLAEAQGVGDPGWAAIVRRATQRFSMLAVASVTVLLASGLVNTWFLAGTVPALVGTDYGRLLLAKIALFIAMLLIAAVNLWRLTPRLADPAARAGNAVWRTVIWLRRNALTETTIGLAVLAIVAALGTLPPGLHSEPGWPFPFRLDLAVLTVGETILFGVVTITFCACGVASVVAAAGGHYRRMAVFAGGIVLCLTAGWGSLRPAVEPAYPTSFYAPAKPYAAASIVQGAALYAENCALCHGAAGRGDGPVAAQLRIRPANLTEPHLLAHRLGDLFWWVTHGIGDGTMPGFADVMTPGQRWDVINFVRARAAGILARGIGPQITTAAAPEIPDFAFEAAGTQGTLNQTLACGPVLLVLFAPPAPVERLAALAGSEPPLSRAELQVIAVEIGRPTWQPGQIGQSPPPFVVGVSHDVIAALALFRASGDGGETELMLDRGGYVRARWTAGGPAGLADVAKLFADAKYVTAVAAAPSQPAHAH